MISVKRFCSLEMTASAAAAMNDLATIATINKDEELRSANVQFMVHDNLCYMAELSQMDRTTPELVVAERVGER